MDPNIKRQYLNHRMPGSFSGATGFKKSGKRTETLDTIIRTLRDIPAYTQHFPIRKRFLRRKVYVPCENNQWGMDLLDVGKWSKQNNKTNFLLTVMDMFSRKAFLEPLKSKSGESVAKAIEKVFKRSSGTPQKIQCDEGKEFYNKNVSDVMKKYNVKLFSVQSELKCCMIERFNRTIRDKIRRYMTHKKSTKYVHKLKEFERMYNTSYHRSIGVSPLEVNSTNQVEIHSRLYGDEDIKKDQRKEIFKVNDRVLISKVKKIFEKGSDPTYGSEIFYIEKIRPTFPRTYLLRDEQGENIIGGFYREEMLKIFHQ